VTPGRASKLSRSTAPVSARGGADCPFCATFWIAYCRWSSDSGEIRAVLTRFTRNSSPIHRAGVQILRATAVRSAKNVIEGYRGGEPTMDGESGRRRVHPMKSASGIPVSGRGRRFERHRGDGVEGIHFRPGNPDCGERMPDRDSDERGGQGGNFTRSKPYPPMAGSAGFRNDAVPRMRPFGFCYRVCHSQAGAAATPCRRRPKREVTDTKVARDTAPIPRNSD
jgi:hypothetical protein